MLRAATFRILQILSFQYNLLNITRHSAPQDTFYSFNILLPYLSTIYTLLNIHKCDNSLEKFTVYFIEVCVHVCSMHVFYLEGFRCKRGPEFATNLKVYMFFLSTFCHLHRYFITLPNVRCTLNHVIILAVDSVLFGLIRIVKQRIYIYIYICIYVCVCVCIYIYI